MVGQAPSGVLRHGGFFVVDCANIAKPRTLGRHPPFPEMTRTVMPRQTHCGDI